MDETRLKSVLESLLIVSEKPISVKEILEALIEGVTEQEAEACLASLRDEYYAQARGMRLREAAGGWQLHTPEENAEVIRNLLKTKPQKLSPAALEALAIVAYRQPVTRPEIEEIRGVDCGGILKVLTDRKLVRILGKKDEVGRPFIYGTSRDFLEFFGLKDLTHLPTLKDFVQLSKELSEREGTDVSGSGQSGELALSEDGEAAGQDVKTVADAGSMLIEEDDPGEQVEDEIIEELNDAITRLDKTRKTVAGTLLLDKTEDGQEDPNQPQGTDGKDGVSGSDEAADDIKAGEAVEERADEDG